MLKIGDSFVFEDDWSHRRSALYYDQGDEEEPASWSVSVGFAQENFDGEEILPSLCINPIDTDKRSVGDLAGASFSVDTMEESMDREDTFYIYEHEPLVNYQLKVLEIRDRKAHIQCAGTLVVDGYADPCTTEKFEIDSWIPVIQSAADWEKFGM